MCLERRRHLPTKRYILRRDSKHVRRDPIVDRAVSTAVDLFRNSRSTVALRVARRQGDEATRRRGDEAPLCEPLALSWFVAHAILLPSSVPTLWLPYDSHYLHALPEWLAYHGHQRLAAGPRCSAQPYRICDLALFVAACSDPITAGCD